MNEFLHEALPLMSQASLENLWDSIRVNWLGPIFLVAVSVFALIFIKDREWSKLIGFVGIAAILAVLIFASDTLFGTSETQTASEPPSPSPSESSSSPSPSATSSPTPTTPSEPADFTMLWWGLGIIAGLVALVLLFFSSKYLWQRSSVHRQKMQEAAKQAREEAERKREEARKAAEEARLRREAEVALWAKSLALSDELEERWMTQQTDLSSILAQPLMTDLTDENTSAAARDFLEMTAQRIEVAPEGATPDSAFPKSVRAFQSSLERAERHARRQKLKKFSPEERKKISRARQLLAQAEGTSFEEERVLAYQRAIKLLEGLVSVPKEAMAVLEAKAPKLALTTGTID